MTEKEQKLCDNFRCTACGTKGKWKDINLNLYSDGEFLFGGTCTACGNYDLEEGRYSDVVSPMTGGAKAPWETQYYSFKCPYCGAYKVRAAKWDDKQFSTAFWGFFSRKLHCNYKCDACNEMWE